MYHDSDDEPLSGDDEVKETRSRKKSKKKSSVENNGRKSSGLTTTGSGSNNTNGYKRRKTSFKGYNICPVIVVDYDLTLVNRSSHPFPGSHEFLEKLREFNDGENQLILYSHGSTAYIQQGLNKHYERERKYFDQIISDGSARDNKPISYVRRVIKNVDQLVGPYVIIDDMRSNLDSDQYDVVIDITRMTKYDQDGKAISIDYKTCLCVLEQGIQAFLKTKTKSRD